MTAPAVTRRTRKTNTRTRRRSLRLPRLGWGWLGIAFTVFVIAKTWPVITGIAVVLAAATAITAVIRPRILAPVINRVARITARRRALPHPNRGHRPLRLFQQMNPTRFEHAIAELALEDDNVHSARQVGQANDRGADVLVHMRDGRRILVQCKKYRHGNNVGSETIQTINGVYRDIHHCHAAVIVTTSGYTRAAHDTNARLPYGIRLVDGPQLEAWANGGQPPWA